MKRSLRETLESWSFISLSGCLFMLDCLKKIHITYILTCTLFYIYIYTIEHIAFFLVKSNSILGFNALKEDI